MNILISGASGLIGSALVPFLRNQRHDIIKLTRKQKRGNCIYWNPAQGVLNLPPSAKIDAVIHLAGENIAEGRWTKEKKKRIRSSRIEGTDLISRKMAELDIKPKVMLCASGIGIYGSRGNKVLTEDDTLGEGFLVNVCREWESATSPAEMAGIRVVLMRIAPVLTPKGGTLKRMLPLFRAGLGASLGAGKQYMSWITIDDLISAINFSLSHEELAGPVNFCSPFPVTNREFTKTLAKTLRVPAPFRVPAFFLKILIGGLSSELLSSTKAIPDRLLKSGFEFSYPKLNAGLYHLLREPGQRK